MKIAEVIRLIGKNFPWIAFCAILLAALVFKLTENDKPAYSSSTLINTGFISGYSPERNAGGKTDQVYTNAEIENLLKLAEAYETKQEIGVRLLAEICVKGGKDKKLIKERGLDEIREALGQDLMEELTDITSYQKTLQNLKRYRDNGERNKLYELLYSSNDLVGVKHLKDLKVERQGRSDVISAKYATSDPGICQRTLEIFIDILSEKHQDNKYRQSSGVVDYFRQVTDNSALQLERAELKLKNFRESNNVINYYEQTRFIAHKREDIKEKYDEERMILAAADSVVRALEDEMSARIDLGTLNQNIGILRDSLSLLSEQMAVYQLSGLDSAQSQADYLRVEESYNRLRKSVSKYNFEVASIQSTPKGAELEKIIEKWLMNIITMEETRAKIRIVKERMESFDEVYAQFAPLGSNIKKLEREIYIKEEDYLQNLHSLNMAILHQQSMMMSTDLTIIDKPIYPTDPDPSQRVMLVAVAFIAGCTLSTGFIFGLAYFDRSIKSPEIASKETGLEVLGALPKFPPEKKKSRVDYTYLKERTIGLILQQLYMDLKLTEKHKRPLRILILSMRQGEGKSFLGGMMVNRLRKYGKEVVYLAPEKETNDEVMQDENNFIYAIHHNLYSAMKEEDLVGEPMANWKSADFLFTELPPLLEQAFPVEILKQADYIIQICRANRVWSNADKKMLLKIQETGTLPMTLLLNGTENYHLESIIGEIPRKRSVFRRMLKRFLTFDFYSKKSI
ncbi:MAG: hypothetical protein MRZ79_22985 [Bacteroidia bacterium]|nr:hypothetical protein [Bacteroidia bacterium]